VRAFLLALVLAAIPSIAYAGCAPGQTPGDGDIESVSITRFSGGTTEPSFGFTMLAAAGLLGAPRRCEATLDSLANAPFKGNYDLVDCGVWDSIVALLHRDGFDSLRLTPNGNGVFLDNPGDTIMVQRCKVTTSLMTAATAFGSGAADDTNFARLAALLKDLQRLVLALPWKPVPSPTP
jgi:hypothetical protein